MPAAQIEQPAASGVPGLVTVPAKPGAQSVHALTDEPPATPPVVVMPAGQGVQDAAPPAEKVPAGHGMQAPAFTGA